MGKGGSIWGRGDLAGWALVEVAVAAMATPAVMVEMVMAVTVVVVGGGSEGLGLMGLWCGVCRLRMMGWNSIT